MATRSSSRLAFSSVVLAVSGLLVPLAAFVSLYHALALWLATCLVAGLILGGIRTQRMKPALGRAALAAACLPGAAIGFYWVRWLATWLKNPNDRSVVLPMFSGFVGPVDSFVLIGIAALALTGFVASLILVFLIALAAEPMTEAMRKTFSFGPEGFDRVNKILIALAAVLASCVAVLSALGIRELPS